MILALSAWQGKPQADSKAGLALWRQPDKLGRACASCHSPDGIELAAYAYDEATIRRRATPHLGPEAAQKVAAYILDLRRHLGIRWNLDPMADRPMQPGGRVLPGSTPEARDRAFALRLPGRLPALMTGRIGTIAQAKAALAEVLRLNLSALRTGILLNRLSEDKFHGNEHASLAHWIPDQVPLPYSPELEQAQNRYLADPSVANLLAIDGMYAACWSRRLQPLEAIALAKARTLLLFQHQLRTGRAISRIQAAPDPDKAPANAFWEIGDLARIYSNATANGIAMPTDIIANKSGGPSFSAQMGQMRLPWLWLGWIADPGLQKTSLDNRTRYADWFSEMLLEEGPYPAHAALMLTKKLATAAFDPSAWASPEPQHLDINFSWILREDNWRRYAPKDARHRQAFYTFLANSFRMFALLLTDEIRRTGITYLREPIVQQLTAMQEVTASVDPGHAKTDATIFDRAANSILRAKFVHR